MSSAIMDQCLQYKSQPPYGGLWDLNRPDIGICGKGYIFEVLVENCRQWRIANGIPVGLGFEREVESACCQSKPDHCQPCEASLNPRSLTFSDLMTGTKSMVSFVAAGMPLVNAAEAERRAAICAKCRFNVRFKTPCSGICDSLKRLVSAIVGQAKTSHDQDLHSCYICGCWLAPAVWVDLATQLKPLSEKQKETFKAVPNCWKREP